MTHQSNTDNPVDFPSGDVIEDILNQEIVRESLLEVEPATDDVLVERMWKLCKGNPWNAVPLYQIMKVAGKI